MSQPSARRTRHKPKTKRPPEATEVTEFRTEVHGLLRELKAWGSAVDCLARQKFSPENMQIVLGGYLNLYVTMSQVLRGALEQKFAQDDVVPRRACLENALSVLTFFQAPILDGVFSEKAPGAVLNELIEAVNKAVKGDDAPEEPTDA